jgi:hypothetical protein
VDSPELQELVERWLKKIRERLPESGTLVVTIHRASRHRYLVSFRAEAFGETFISEVRQERLADGVKLAGSGLFDRLGLDPPQRKPGLGERVRRLFFPDRNAA